MMDSLIGTAVNDLGINRLRMQLPGNMVESRDTVTLPEELRLGTNDNDDPRVRNPAGFQWTLVDGMAERFILPMKRKLEARGEPFVLTATYVGFREGSQFQQRDTAEYNEFMLTALDHLRDKYGIVPDLWEIRLEPDHGQRPISAHQQGVLLASAARAARAAGYGRLGFSVPSTVVPHRAVAYLEEILKVPGTREAITEVGFHRYTPPPRDVLTGIRDAARALGRPTAMLEFSRGGERELMEDLLYADVSAWSRFSLAGPSGGPEAGGQYFYVDTAAATFQYRSTTWPLRQFFKYVRPGAVRIGATSADPAVTVVAFRKPRGGFVVVANTSGETVLRITGLPPGNYAITWADRQGANPGSLLRTTGSEPLTVTVPGKETVTITSSP